MFQTEIVIFLQSFASDFLTSFFVFFTEIGRSTYTKPLLLIILFGVSFRAGYILVHVVAWNGLTTFCLKEYFSLPRPANVDLNVKLLGKSYPNPTHFESMGAKGFFGGLPEQVVEYLRAHPIDSWGFPSGHTSHAMALWASIFMFFKKTWVRIIVVVMIVFIPLSRMYLGQHFLADILGGFLIGSTMVLVFYNLVFRNEKLKSFLFEKLGKMRFDLKSVLVFAYFLIVPFLVLLVPNIDSEVVASFLGFNSGFLLIRSRGIPKDSGNVLQRIARVLIAGVFFFVLQTALEEGTNLLFTNEPMAVKFIRQTLTLLLFFWGSTEISIKLGLFKR